MIYNYYITKTIIKCLKKESELPNLISNLYEDKHLEKLVILFFIINSSNKIFSLLTLLCIIKKKEKMLYSNMMMNQ